MPNQYRVLLWSAHVSLARSMRFNTRTKDLAAALGRDPDWVSFWCGRGSARKRDDAEFRCGYESLNAALSETGRRANRQRKSARSAM
jgi:hypothetical protein